MIDTITIQVQDSLGHTAVKTLTVNITPSVPMFPPVFNPPAGSYTGAQGINLTGPLNSIIFYTLDGSTPTHSSTLYVGTIVVAVSTTIKCIATNPRYFDSAVSTAAYVISGAGGTLTLQQDGFPSPAPLASVGIPYELGISVTNTTNAVSWTVLAPAITASFIPLTSTRAIFSWPSPIAIGGPVIIQATDTITLNTGTISLNI